VTAANRVYGRIKAGKGTLFGDAAEHFVLAELLRREIVAALAPRNMPSYDILAVNGTNSAKVRVKSKTAADTFVWNAKKDGKIFTDVTANDFSVLVDMGVSTSAPLYYVVPTADLEARLQDRYQEWLKTPGKGDRSHKPNRMRRLDDPGWQQWLANYKGPNGWPRLLKALGIEESA
jgi:hypothetical protein